MEKTAYTSEQMLAKLVGFNTISEYSNLDLIHWVRDYLKSYGIESVLVYDATKTKANLHAIVGPRDVAGVILSGHTDVVPVEGQAWDSEPFTLRAQNGLLYGRGACDMKGFLAVALSKLPQMLQKPLKAPVHFALSYDEEVGCIGAHALSDEILSGAARPRLCIVGEPTSMKLITGHKGVGDYAVTVHGKEAHSSLAPTAVNAVEAAAELVVFIRKIARRMQEEGPFNNDFDPPFTTLQTGVMRGGTAMNIVPNRCDLEVEIRNLPETDVSAIYEEIRQYAFKNIEPRMKDIDPKSGFEFRTAAISPSFHISNDDPAVELVRALSGSNSCEKVSFATEAGIFQGKGIPTIVCGPGSIEQAHKPNEFIAQEQLARCESFIDRLLDHLCAA